MQLSKTVYFRDYSEHSGARSGLTIPFPEAEHDTYRAIAHLSSYRLRQIIGYELYAELEKAAFKSRHPVATFARALIKKNTRLPNAAALGRAEAFQATFKGGEGSPLHDWYPYLEGYSPDFVSSIIAEYSPNAQRILDPFCGSGTTALVSALLGRQGLYSEVNPVCRTIIEAKAQALALSSNTRSVLSEKLATLAGQLRRKLAQVKPDVRLRQSFALSFGDRPFFSDECFDDALRLRTLIDEIGANDTELAQFLLVAVLRSLVPGSLLVRRGDLRFRTEAELSKSKQDLLGEVTESLHIISSDLLDASAASGTVVHVCDDARLLSSNLRSPVDAIITSPPYLNGTNYFRNTKIELWFLRFLANKSGLRGFRDAAITAGINDVTQGKSVNTKFTASSLLDKVLGELEADAYDVRIPLMVKSYFQEMNEVARSLRAVCRPETTVAIDLGDSCYGKVWVPTDAILSSLMLTHGFKQMDRVILRERQSRDGRKLSQVLLVFETSEPKSARSATKRSDGHTRWAEFRENLPHQNGEMAKRNWGHSWHSMCSYQGKLKPSIANVLVHALLPAKGGRLLDPFSGVGTIPFEARLAGHTAYGFDINPSAVAISRAKLEGVSADEVRSVINDLGKFVSSSRAKIDLKRLEAIRFNGPLPTYFHPDTLKEIVRARQFFKKRGVDDAAAAFVHSCLLHILHGNRPYALSRRSHPITPFAPTGPVEYRALIERLSTKVERCLADLGTIPDGNGRAFAQDATAAWPDEVAELDAIITSPPFFDSTRFHTANWMRLWFSGWEIEDFSSQPEHFVDERQKKTFEVYETIFKQGNQRLKRGGHFAVHLGKSRKCDMAAMLKGVGARHLEFIDLFSESVSHCESHGIRDKGTVTDHQYLLFRKP